jgi:hypothetical protein
MLSSASRVARPTMPLVLSLTQLQRYGDRWIYPVDVVTVDQFPQRARHAKLLAPVRPVSFLLGGGIDKDDHTKRIMREVCKVPNSIHSLMKLSVENVDGRSASSN